MSTQVVLITLSGQGDMEIFFVPKAAYDWMVSQQASDVDIPIPAYVQEALRPFCEYGDDEDEGFLNEVVYCSSRVDNDIALTFSCIMPHFDTQRKALAHAAKMGWEVLEEEYNGYIY